MTINPSRCDPDVWEHGEAILVLASISGRNLDRICQIASNISKQKIDWSSFAGRMRVAVYGDKMKAVAALVRIWRIIDRASRIYHREFGEPPYSLPYRGVSHLWVNIDGVNPTQQGERR